VGGVLVLVTVPEIGAAEDRAMAERLGFADGSVEGCRFRLSGPADGPGRRIATYWESSEAFERWRDDALATALQATGNPVPTFEIWPIESALGLS
jgi:hypothetical protein